MGTERSCATAGWRSREPGARTKLDVVRAASEHAFPVADIERMLEEIESGYRGPA